MKSPLDLHRDLLRLRRGEELLARLYKQQEMRTPTHFGIGQEAISVGVCAALDLTKDAVFTHHRSHLAYLGCGGSFEQLAAELYGRETGCARGRGGSVHLTAREHGFVASSAILGQMIAVATGAALAFKMDKQDRVAVCFFGEGACEEGIFYEAMNYAAINHLPVIFVCENNLYATESPLDVRQPRGTDLRDRAFAFKFHAERIDGNDVLAVQRAAIQARRWALNNQPVFLECETYRHLEHVGPNYDHEAGRTYRNEEELRRWQARDPLKISAHALITSGGADASGLEFIDQTISQELVLAAKRAHAAPAPDRSTLLENVA